MEDGRPVCHDMEEFYTSVDGVYANWPNRFFARSWTVCFVKTGE